ncbi:MAG TPA: hypothetical protein DDZ53_11790 [Firmicutes bacterium]|nr:hypothetical protein [Bacillota bacterium]
MNCKDVVELLPLFLDAELEPNLAADVEAHLATCSSCQQLLQDFKREQQILRSLPSVEPPPAWRAELLAQVGVTKRRAKPAWQYFVPRLGSLAAALVVMLLVSNLLVFPTYFRPKDKDMPGESPKLMMSAPQNTEEAPAANEPALSALFTAGAMKSRENIAADADDTEVMALAEAPTDNLQMRWWIWSSSLGIVIWLSGAGYYYYRYRRLLREQTE